MTAPLSSDGGTGGSRDESARSGPSLSRSFGPRLLARDGKNKGLVSRAGIETEEQVLAGVLAVGWRKMLHLGTQFTCFTSTKVQILTPLGCPERLESSHVETSHIKPPHNSSRSTIDAQTSNMQAPSGSGEGEEECVGEEREESMGEERGESVGGLWGEESVGVRRQRKPRRASSEANTPFASESESERKDGDEGATVKGKRMKRELQEVKEWVRFVNR